MYVAHFYLKKRLDQNDKEKLWSLGEKGIIFEPFQSRIYTHANLYSHILGQVDYDNYGISGVEKYFDKELKDKKLLKNPLQLTLDTNIQHVIDDELNSSLKIFKATIFSIRNGVYEKATPGWKISDEEDIDWLGELFDKDVDVTDL